MMWHAHGQRPCRVLLVLVGLAPVSMAVPTGRRRAAGSPSACPITQADAAPQAHPARQPRLYAHPAVQATLCAWLLRRLTPLRRAAAKTDLNDSEANLGRRLPC
jgi:hypothetical protein